jgi:hypothetical protein
VIVVRGNFTRPHDNVPHDLGSSLPNDHKVLVLVADPALGSRTVSRAHTTSATA